MNFFYAILILCVCLVFGLVFAKCFWMSVEWWQERKWHHLNEAEKIRKRQQNYRDFLDRAP